ncbi:hypothetical protein [Sporolactobacillus inulinus]|uniref:hypothetical protein n=1 Tax=Sporolactobacillus inulinus TaxID=2078 RepID=UPI0021CD0F3A|nr:hypothetical protein [Sporolactobacillus inulinus]
MARRIVWNPVAHINSGQFGAVWARFGVPNLIQRTSIRCGSTLIHCGRAASLRAMFRLCDCGLPFLGATVVN